MGGAAGSGFSKLDAELDPVGASVGPEDPYVDMQLYEAPDETSPSLLARGNPANLRGKGCSRNGIPEDCGSLMHELAHRAGGVANKVSRIDVRTLTISSVVGYWAWGGDGGSKGDVEVINSNLRPITYTSTYRDLATVESWEGQTGGGAAPQPPAQPQKSDSFTRAVSKAFDRVTDIFKNNPNSPCAQWFGPDALTVLNAMRQTPPVIKQKTDTPGATATGIQQSYGQSRAGSYGKYRLPTDFIVFTNGPFFSGGKGQIGTYIAGTYGAQNLAILHELAHNIIKNGKYLIRNDGNDANLSRDNTNEVLKHCSDEVFNAK